MGKYDMRQIRRLETKEEKQAAAAAVLSALPQWFGIPESTAEYVENCGELPVWAAMEQGNVIGFLALKRTSPCAMEIYVMGVCPQHHRQGVGEALLNAAERAALAANVEFLQVKTVEPGHYAEYDRTVDFYQAMGFRVLEVFPTLWDPWNPCLLLVKKL
ncbi:MAG TPA: GNAT family N-acetyltransferase [Candidatus Faecousia intestinigallinarum]|nr:GNAT family N-acetyltransferase [Candidatus Faecousia intestinigallinarum]